jgi:YVTN family beta-propeller protein
MSQSIRWLTLVLALAFVSADIAEAGRRRGGVDNHPALGHQTFTSPQSNPVALSADGSLLYVANTTSSSVSVIHTASQTQIAQIEVGLEPVSVAVKPDGTEVWVSNHVSDSVSVIDVVPGSDTFRRVVETIQDVDGDGVSWFDEPVGIAFAGNAKAYVALSSRNEVAIIDTATYAVTGVLPITNQEPRAITVRDVDTNGDQTPDATWLFVAAFESFNQSELSTCPDPNDPGNGGPPPGSDPVQCTMGTGDLADFVIESPNIPGSDTNIVIDPDVPDRDVFVFDTATDTPVSGSPVSGVGTLLYGLAATGDGQVFVSQTDARNAENGSIGQNLEVLDNRMFLNQLGRVDCTNGGPCALLSDFELEALPPSQPAAGDQLATPYGIALSGNDETLFVTSAGNSRLFSVDITGGAPAILHILDLDGGVPADAGQQIPKGVAVHSDGNGAPQTAYVLNTLENTVSVVNVSNPANLVHVTKIPVGSDPTPDAVRRGRIAFNNAFGSTTGTFSCESCHPDSNTDQLLWRIGGECSHNGCGNGEHHARSTMPVRGLKNTLPLHWDGTLGDPFGGGNGAVGFGGSGGTDCNLGGPDGDHDCFRALVDASLQGVMCTQGTSGGGPPVPGCPNDDQGELTETERDDMASFLASVAYPPPRSRRMDDSVSPLASSGFSDFFVDVGGAGSLPQLGSVQTCADMDSGCHALPLGADTNSVSLGGFDVPTMRGMTDRTLQFSLGITNSEEVLAWASAGGQIDLLGFTLNFPGSAFFGFPWDPANGLSEETTFAAAFPIFGPVYNGIPGELFQMFEEASTGFSGALGRQVTLRQETTTGGALADTEAIMDALEDAADRGSVNLRAVGARNLGSFWVNDTLSYRPATQDYRSANDAVIFDHAGLLALAQAGNLVTTLTAALPENFGSDPQPLLSVTTTGAGATGNPDLPVLPGDNPMTLVGIDVHQDADVIVNGLVVSASLSCVGGSFTGSPPLCDSQTVEIDLTSIPSPNGLHLLQVQNPLGPLSPELPICVGAPGNCQ